MYNHDLGTEFSGLFTALAHVNYNVRVAAAQGLAFAMDDLPSCVQVSCSCQTASTLEFFAVFLVRRLKCLSAWFLQETLSTLFSLYVKYLPSLYGESDPFWTARQGVALALKAAADVLTMKDLPVVATFLISRSLVCFLNRYRIFFKEI